jgi:hypothetical protein
MGVTQGSVSLLLTGFEPKRPAVSLNITCPTRYPLDHAATYISLLSVVTGYQIALCLDEWPCKLEVMPRKVLECIKPLEQKRLEKWQAVLYRRFRDDKEGNYSSRALKSQ